MDLTSNTRSLPAVFCVMFLCSVYSVQSGSAADIDGPTVYQQHCAACHDASSVTRAPAPAALRGMSPENIIRALETGLMKDQGSTLNTTEKQLVAEFLSGRRMGEARTANQTGLCSDPKTAFSVAGPAWNGWGNNLVNSRFQTEKNARLAPAQVPRLKLKWAFAFPDTSIANGQPTVVGGRVFVPSANGRVYSLDARSGCQYWAFEFEAPVRAAISVATLSGVGGPEQRSVAFFGDRKANAYAVDAASGQLLWKVKVDDQPRAGISGAPVYFGGRLYVPIADAEEGPAVNVKFECCKGRGALAALDAATGKQIWKTYTTPEARPTSRNTAGTQLWGPSGASIWSAPTLDTERQLIYAGTGNNFSEPSTKTSDAILAFEMKTGKIVWTKQLTEIDAYNVGCRMTDKQGCPDSDGPDFDIGASPILVKLANGRSVLLVSQKSGVAHALDPDKQGAVIWAHRVGKGSPLGGIQWGSATDGRYMYVANSDISFTKPSFERGEKRVLDPKPGGGLFAISIATGERVWAAVPPVCGDRPACSPAQSAAVTAIPGAVFSGSVDGHIRGYSTADGKVIWEYDTAREFKTVNGVPGKGGSLDSAGPTIAGGMLFVESGYGTYSGLPGNVLLAFSIDGN